MGFNDKPDRINPFQMLRHEALASATGATLDEVFSRFIEATGNKNDVLLAISTGGNSENVVRTAYKAKELDMKIVALTKEGSNKLQKIADITIAGLATLFSDRVQESQLTEAQLGHG